MNFSHKRLCFVVIFLSLVVFPLVCQEQFIPQKTDPLLEPWRWRHFPMLTEYGFKDLAEDEHGTMWFVVNNGLISYDGYNWEEHFYNGEIPFTQYFDIETHNNIIYISTKGALFQYSNKQWKIIEEFGKGFVNQSIEIESATGNLFITSTKGIGFYNGTNFYYYCDKSRQKSYDSVFNRATVMPFPKEVKEASKGNYKHAIEHPDGYIYMLYNGASSAGGILKVRSTTNKFNPVEFSFDESISGRGNFAYRSSASIVNNNEIWIGTRITNKGMSVYKNGKWELQFVSKMFGDRDIYSGIIQMNDGNVLVSSEGQLYTYNHNNWKRYQFPEIPLTSTGYIITCRTKDGNLWIGGENNDVYFVEYSNQRWETYNNLFYQFNIPGGERVFLSNDNQIVFQKDDKWWAYNAKHGLIDAPTKAFLAKDNITWCSGSHKGIAALAYYYNNKWHKVVSDSASATVETRSIFVDNDGSIFYSGKIGATWVGGVYHIKFDKDKGINTSNYTDGFPDAVTGGIARDKNNNLVVSFVQAVSKYNSNFTVEPFKNLPGKHSTLSSSPGKIVWFGTESRGLYRWDGNTAENFNIKNGLVSNIVTNLCADTDNTLWIATEKDITRYDGTTWINNVFDGQFIIEKESGDLKVDETGALWINIVPKKWILKALNPNSEYDFSKGFYAVKCLPDNKPPMCNFEFYQSVIDPVGNTHITWSGIDYMNETSGDQLLFSYKLNDDEWTKYTPGRSNTFLSLESGKHTLQLKSKDKYGNTSKLSDTIKFRVKWPVYLRMWFLTMVALFVTIIAFLIRRIIIKNQKLKSFNFELQEQQQEIIAQNEEIMQQSEEISAQRDALAEQNEEIRTQKEMVSHSLHQLKVVSEFGQKLTSNRDISVIHNMMYKYVDSLVTIQAFGIGFYSKVDNCIVYPEFIENGHVLDEFTKSLDDENSLTSYCFNKQESLFITDIRKQYKQYVPELNKSTTKEIAQSRIHIPLTVEDKKIGILVINSYAKNAYNDSDLTNIQTIASYISIALDNASAYETINSINKNTEKSINYASSIQNAFLPQTPNINKFINTFVLFKPKDIVSGDYYWFLPIEEDASKPTDVLIAAMDCTGHGVPGALMSLVGNNLMREIIKNNKVYQPADILTQLNLGVKEALKQEQTGNNDGMDASMVRIQQTTANAFKVLFGGAKNPLVVIRSTGEMDIIKGSRFSIGGAKLRTTKVFEQQELMLQSGDQMYLFSDGYSDQNGPDREKFGRENMLKLIQENAALSMPEQQQKLEEALQQHMQNAEQRDDITVIGIKL